MSDEAWHQDRVGGLPLLFAGGVIIKLGEPGSLPANTPGACYLLLVCHGGVDEAKSLVEESVGRGGYEHCMGSGNC